MPDWLKTFPTTHMQWVVDVIDFCFWSEWSLWVCSYEQKQPPRNSLKYKAVHEFRILAKFLKNTLKFSNFGNMQTAACNSSKKWSFSEVFFRDFAYFLGITILRNSSYWRLSCITRLSRLLSRLVLHSA